MLECDHAALRYKVKVMWSVYGCAVGRLPPGASAESFLNPELRARKQPTQYWPTTSVEVGGSWSRTLSWRGGSRGERGHYGGGVLLEAKVGVWCLAATGVNSAALGVDSRLPRACTYTPSFPGYFPFVNVCIFLKGWGVLVILPEVW